VKPRRQLILWLRATHSNVALLDQPANVNILEDGSMQTVNHAGISADPANESGQTLTVRATSSNLG
jgi:hypothetical protein